MMKAWPSLRADVTTNVWFDDVPSPDCITNKTFVLCIMYYLDKVVTENE